MSLFIDEGEPQTRFVVLKHSARQSLRIQPGRSPTGAHNMGQCTGKQSNRQHQTTRENAELPSPRTQKALGVPFDGPSSSDQLMGRSIDYHSPNAARGEHEHTEQEASTQHQRRKAISEIMNSDMPQREKNLAIQVVFGQMQHRHVFTNSCCRNYIINPAVRLL